MATTTYITGQLVKITLNGSYGDLARNRVRGFINGEEGFTAGIFPLSEIVSETSTSDNTTNYTSRTTQFDALDANDLTTISVTDAQFDIPNSVLIDNDMTITEAKEAILEWLETISDTSVDPYVVVS
jgi:hypothetical protein